MIKMQNYCYVVKMICGLADKCFSEALLFFKQYVP